MPDIGFEAAIVLLMLLPGFISASIVQSFAPSEERNELDKVTQALIHTFLIAVCYAAVTRHLPIQVNSWPRDGGTHYTVEVFRWRLLLLLGIAVAWGALVTVCSNWDWPWKYFRTWGLTRQSARASVWHDVFYEYAQRGYVQVELKDGRFALGYVRHFSHDAKDPYLFLEDASWIGVGKDGDAEVVRIPGAGVLLSKDSGIVNVMFLQPATKPDAQESKAACAG